MVAKRWLTVSAIVLSVLAVSGCLQRSTWREEMPHDAPSGGQTLQQAQTALEAIPGIRVVDLSTGPPNIKRNTGYTVDLEVEPGYRIADGATLVTFAMTTVWSIREGYMSNTDVQISVRTPPGGESFNIPEAAIEAQWSPIDSVVLLPNEWSVVPVVVDPEKEQGALNVQRLGPWPGDVPELPPGITEQT